MVGPDFRMSSPSYIRVSILVYIFLPFSGWEGREEKRSVLVEYGV